MQYNRLLTYEYEYASGRYRNLPYQMVNDMRTNMVNLYNYRYKYATPYVMSPFGFTGIPYDEISKYLQASKDASTYLNSLNKYFSNVRYYIYAKSNYDDPDYLTYANTLLNGFNEYQRNLNTFNALYDATDILAEAYAQLDPQLLLLSYLRAVNSAHDVMNRIKENYNYMNIALQTKYNPLPPHIMEINKRLDEVTNAIQYANKSFEGVNKYQYMYQYPVFAEYGAMTYADIDSYINFYEQQQIVNDFETYALVPIDGSGTTNASVDAQAAGDPSVEYATAYAVVTVDQYYPQPYAPIVDFVDFIENVTQKVDSQYLYDPQGNLNIREYLIPQYYAMLVGYLDDALTNGRYMVEDLDAQPANDQPGEEYKYDKPNVNYNDVNYILKNELFKRFDVKNVFDLIADKVAQYKYYKYDDQQAIRNYFKDLLQSAVVGDIIQKYGILNDPVYINAIKNNDLAHRFITGIATGYSKTFYRFIDDQDIQNSDVSGHITPYNLKFMADTNILSGMNNVYRLYDHLVGGTNQNIFERNFLRGAAKTISTYDEMYAKTDAQRYRDKLQSTYTDKYRKITAYDVPSIYQSILDVNAIQPELLFFLKANGFVERKEGGDYELSFLDKITNEKNVQRTFTPTLISNKYQRKKIGLLLEYILASNAQSMSHPLYSYIMSVLKSYFPVEGEFNKTETYELLTNYAYPKDLLTTVVHDHEIIYDSLSAGEKNKYMIYDKKLYDSWQRIHAKTYKPSLTKHFTEEEKAVITTEKKNLAKLREFVGSERYKPRIIPKPSRTDEELLIEASIEYAEIDEYRRGAYVPPPQSDDDRPVTREQYKYSLYTMGQPRSHVSVTPNNDNQFVSSMSRLEEDKIEKLSGTKRKRIDLEKEYVIPIIEVPSYEEEDAKKSMGEQIDTSSANPPAPRQVLGSSLEEEKKESIYGEGGLREGMSRFGMRSIRAYGNKISQDVTDLVGYRESIYREIEMMSKRRKELDLERSVEENKITEKNKELYMNLMNIKYLDDRSNEIKKYLDEMEKKSAQLDYTISSKEEIVTRKNEKIYALMNELAAINMTIEEKKKLASIDEMYAYQRQQQKYVEHEAAINAMKNRLKVIEDETKYNDGKIAAQLVQMASLSTNHMKNVLEELQRKGVNNDDVYTLAKYIRDFISEFDYKLYSTMEKTPSLRNYDDLLRLARTSDMSFSDLRKELSKAENELADVKYDIRSKQRVKERLERDVKTYEEEYKKIYSFRMYAELDIMKQKYDTIYALKELQYKEYKNLTLQEKYLILQKYHQEDHLFQNYQYLSQVEARVSQTYPYQTRRDLIEKIVRTKEGISEYRYLLNEGGEYKRKLYLQEIVLDNEKEKNAALAVVTSQLYAQNYFVNASVAQFKQTFYKYINKLANSGYLIFSGAAMPAHADLVHFNDDIRDKLSAVVHNLPQIGIPASDLDRELQVPTTDTVVKFLSIHNVLGKYDHPIKEFNYMFYLAYEHAAAILKKYMESGATVIANGMISEKLLANKDLDRGSLDQLRTHFHKSTKDAINTINGLTSFMVRYPQMIHDNVIETNSRFVDTYSIFGNNVQTIINFYDSLASTKNSVEYLYESTGFGDRDIFKSTAQMYKAIETIDYNFKDMRRAIYKSRDSQVFQYMKDHFQSDTQNLIYNLQRYVLNDQGLGKKVYMFNAGYSMVAAYTDMHKDLVRNFAKRFITLGYTNNNTNYFAKDFTASESAFIKTVGMIDNLTNKEVEEGWKNFEAYLVKSLDDDYIRSLYAMISASYGANIAHIISNMNPVQAKKMFSYTHFAREFLQKTINAEALEAQPGMGTLYNMISREYKEIAYAADYYATNLTQHLTQFKATLAAYPFPDVEPVKKSVIEKELGPIARYLEYKVDISKKILMNSKFGDKDKGKFLSYISLTDENIYKGNLQKRFIFDYFYNTTFAAFQYKLKYMDTIQTNEVKKYLAEEQKMAMKLKTSGYVEKDAAEKRRDPDMEQKITHYLAADAIAYLYKNKDTLKILKPLMYMDGVYSFQNVSDYATHLVNDGQNVAHVVDSLIIGAFPRAIGILRSACEYYVGKQLPIPDNTHAYLEHLSNYIDNIRHFVDYDFSKYGRLVYLDLKKDIVKGYLDLLDHQVNHLGYYAYDYNAKIGDVTIDQLTAASAEIIKHERAAEFVDKYNDVREKAIEKGEMFGGRILDKFMLKWGDVVGRLNDDEGGRKYMRNVAQYAIPRAYMHVNADQQYLKFAYPYSDRANELYQYYFGGSANQQYYAGLFPYKVAKEIEHVTHFNDDTVNFIRHVSIDKKTGRPMYDGVRELTQEERTRLARILVGIVIAFYMKLFTTKEERADLDKNALMEEVRAEKGPQKFVDLIGDLVDQYIKKRNNY